MAKKYLTPEIIFSLFTDDVIMASGTELGKGSDIVDVSDWLGGGL